MRKRPQLARTARRPSISHRHVLSARPLRNSTGGLGPHPTGPPDRTKHSRVDHPRALDPPRTDFLVQGQTPVKATAVVQLPQRVETSESAPRTWTLDLAKRHGSPLSKRGFVDLPRVVASVSQTFRTNCTLGPRMKRSVRRS